MTKTVREFSRCGPCITRGTLVKETKQFYCFTYAGACRLHKIRKPLPGHYSPAHVEPCPSCRDHPKTQYREGYMD